MKSIYSQELRTPKINFKNRIIMAPMATGLTNADGSVSEKMLEHYRSRAAGGYLGLIITEHFYVHPDGNSGKMPSVASDDMIEGLTALADAVHQEGVPIVLQINYIKNLMEQGGEGAAGQWPTVAEIASINKSFAEAARRVKMAGFDGVEIHGTHGFLLNQFYSPLTNLRKDEYGGRLPNRMRCPLEVVQSVRESVGENYPVFFRLGACDYMRGGNTVLDGVEAAKMLESAGIDILDISGGLCFYTHPTKTGPGYFADSSSAIKREIKLPVIITGGVKTLEQADKLLQENCGDLIGIGRSLMADPYWMKNQLD